MHILKKETESIFLFPTQLLHAVCDCFIVCLSTTLLRRAKTALICVQKMGFITNSTSLFWQKKNKFTFLRITVKQEVSQLFSHH